MNRTAFIIFFLALSLFAKGQTSEFCKVLVTCYNDIAGNKYIKTYIADSTYPDRIESEDLFFSNFKSEINTGKLKKANLQLKAERSISKIICFNDTLLRNKKAILRHLYDNRNVIVSNDSLFVKFIDQKQQEISKVPSMEEREKLLNQLTLTPEFKKYSELIDYYTPRLIEFSQPVFIDKYCFVKINVIKNYSDDRYSYQCLYKNIGKKWQLIKKAKD